MAHLFNISARSATAALRSAAPRAASQAAPAVRIPSGRLGWICNDRLSRAVESSPWKDVLGDVERQEMGGFWTAVQCR